MGAFKRIDLIAEFLRRILENLEIFFFQFRIGLIQKSGSRTFIFLQEILKKEKKIGQ